MSGNLKLYVGICVSLFLSQLSSFAITNDQILTNRKVVAIYSEFDLGQKAYAKAEKRMRDHLAADSTDSSGWAFLGKILEDALKPELAGEAYKSSTRVAPHGEAGRYHYLYADFLNRRNQTSDAISELKLAIQDEISAPAAKLAMKKLRPGTSLPQYFEEIDQSTWSGYLGFAGGYDSNVLLLSESTLDSVSISNTQSPSFLFFGALRYQNIFAKGNFDAKAFSSITSYSAESAQSFNSLAERLAFTWMWKLTDSHQVGFGNSADASFLNSDGFEYFNMTNRFFPEFDWQILPWWKTKWTLGGSYIHYNQDNPTAGNERSGYSLSPEIANEFYWGSSVISLGGSYERVWADGYNFNLHSYQVPVSLTTQLPDKWIGALSFRWAINNYSDSSDSRVDYVYQPTLMVGRTFYDKISTYIQYGFTQNLSSTDSAQYSKHSASLLVNYAFK